jgi:hypothetical protein
VKTRNTIIAGNSASSNGPDVQGPFTSQGYNLIGKSDGSSGFTNGTNGDQVGTSGSPLDPMLGPLQDNGGPTQTHALLAGSPALDAGTTFPVATSASAVAAGSAVVTPSDVSQIPGVGNSLNIDSGLSSHEQVVITARTATSFTATFTKALAAGFTISLVEHDQRGQPRPFDNPSITNASGGDGSDIGTFEAQPNRPPVASCKNIQVSADSNCSANIGVADINDGSSDPDADDTITLSFDPSSVVTFATLSGAGNHTVTLYVTDSHGAQSSCTSTVHVVDTTPPSISGASASPNTIWPPNGKLVDVLVSYSTADNCSAVNSQLSISSNEPTASGDMVVVDNHHVRLRADRLASGKGRIYTITIKATDQSGNSAQRSVTVTVPHDQGK